MSEIRIYPAKSLSAKITPPGDKSISHRAVMLGAIAEGESRLINLLESKDVLSTASAFRSLGVEIKKDREGYLIKGAGLGGLKEPKEELDLGNSGTTARLISGILAGQKFTTRLIGDASLSQRPMGRIIKPLAEMGARIKSRGENYLPLEITGGGLKPIDYSSPLASAQVKSAVLLAGLYADGITSVTEPFRSRDHTERMLKAFGAEMRVEGLKVSVRGGARLRAQALVVPGDFSSASFFIIAGLILDNSEIEITNTGLNPTRTGLIEVLKRMGAQIEITNLTEAAEPVGTVISRSSKLSSTVVKRNEIPGLIDEVPVLIVAATQAEGTTVIEGVEELRIKETDRIESMTANLTKMGARIETQPGRIEITGKSPLHGAAMDSYRDHRTAMAAAIAGLAARGESIITNSDCVNISYPGFFEEIENLKKG